MSTNWTEWNGIPLADCTLKTCPLVAPDGTVLANNSYDPSLGGNALYLAIFGLAALCQLILGVRYRTWGVMIALIFGFGLEVCGYAGRIGQSLNPFDGNTFLLYLVTITIAPAFLCAGIYLTLARIIRVYSSADSTIHITRFEPRVYAISFVTCDVICILAQIVGGILTASSTIGTSSYNTGVNTLIAGISMQVASLIAFSICSLDVVYCIRHAPTGQLNTRFKDLREKNMFRGFLWAVAIEVVTILIRSAFRIAELSGGFNGPLFNQQVTFMILEGMMMSICAICLTAFHPGSAFGGQWEQAVWHIGTNIAKADLC